MGSSSFVFGARNQLQGSTMEIDGNRDVAGDTRSMLHSDFIDALRMSVLSTNMKHHGDGLGDELSEIILAARANVTTQGNNMVIYPIREYHASDADDEDSDHDQYLDMDSIENFEVSFTTRLRTLENSVVYEEDQPEERTPIAIITHK